MLDIGESARSTLGKLFSPNRPFGPIAAESIVDLEIADAFYFGENAAFQDNKETPTIVEGRKGSGKTALLHSPHIRRRFHVIVELSTADLFGKVLESIQALQVSQEVAFVEECAALWNVTLWATVLPVMLKTYPLRRRELATVDAYLRGLGLPLDADPFAVMQAIVRTLRDRARHSTGGMVREFTTQMPFNNVVFNDARDAVVNFLAAQNHRAIILVDSLEDLQLSINNVQLAMQGFLKCVGAFQNSTSPCRIQCCLPAELHQTLHSISTNPNKDFANRLLITWDAKELIRLAALRYGVFLQLHYPKEFNSLERQSQLPTWEGASALLSRLLPSEVENLAGIREAPLPYILRHTQLLPRQVLLYLNAIAEENIKRNENPLVFSAQAIRDGVFKTEALICDEIFAAFRALHPGAQELCQKSIPRLPPVFHGGELHTVYHRYGKGISGVSDFHDFLGLLRDIGGVGRVDGYTDRYVKATFNYALPHQLVLVEDQELCLHPALLKVFSARQKSGTPIAIYPRGSDFSEENGDPVE